MRVIKFSAVWCGPCKAMKPEWDKIVQAGGAEFEEVDIDANPDLVAQYNIMSVPTILFIKDDKVVSSKFGICNAEEIAGEIQKYG